MRLRQAVADRKAAADREAEEARVRAAASVRQADAERQAADERQAAADRKAAADREAEEAREREAARVRQADAERQAADERQAAADRKAAADREAEEAREREAARVRQTDAEHQAAGERQASAGEAFDAAVRAAVGAVWQHPPAAFSAAAAGSPWHPPAAVLPSLPAVASGNASTSSAGASPAVCDSSVNAAPPLRSTPQSKEIPPAVGSAAPSVHAPPSSGGAVGRPGNSVGGLPASGSERTAAATQASMIQAQYDSWTRLFVNVGAIFDAIPRGQLISVLIKAEVYPYYLINFAAGRSVHTPPATKKGLEPWFTEVLRGALPAGLYGEITQLGPFLISNLLTVINLLYAKFNNDLPDGGFPDATVAPLLGAVGTSLETPAVAAPVAHPMDSTPSVPASAPPPTSQVPSGATVPPTSAPVLAEGGIAPHRPPRKTVRQGAGSKKAAVLEKVYPSKQDPTWRRMMVAARILLEEYDAENDVWSDVDNIRPDVVSETKKNICAESLRIMLSSFRWGGHGKPESRVYDKLRDIAMNKPGVDNKEKARVYILRLWHVAWADKDWKDKEEDREVTATSAGKKKPSVRVPWHVWLDELRGFVAELDKLREKEAAVAATSSARLSGDVAPQQGVVRSSGDERDGPDAGGDGADADNGPECAS